MDNIYLLCLTFGSSVTALIFSIFLAVKILKKSTGNKKMQKISLAIQQGAGAYLKRQYLVVVLFFLSVFSLLIWLAFRNYLTWFVPFAFLTGGFFSGLSGFLGMKIATKANVRTAEGCRHGLNNGLKIAFSSGLIMGLVVVGLGLLDISIWYYILKFVAKLSYSEITATMLTFGMGASSMALFARLGGGIYTKAADVGADLVGKVEVGIPEDDSRNPAVIADNVGDNVGDVAGMGADLYESYVGSIIATMALGVTAFASKGLALQALIIPMAMSAAGIIAAIIGSFFVKTKDNPEQTALLWALRKGTYIASLIVVVLSFLIIKFTLPTYLGIYFSILSGLFAGLIIGAATEFFTSDKYKPTKFVARSAQTGPATVVISGIALGMLSTAIPVLTIIIAIFLAFSFAGGLTDSALGLYGVGIAAVGMLSTLGITLATDAYGPVADNAGGIAQMAGLSAKVRQRTDALDMLGNTTAATGKGFAIGSAALTSMALISAYQQEVLHVANKLAIDFSFNLSINDIKVLLGLFIGGVLPFIFSGITMLAVGRAAEKIVLEVRRQFIQIKGLLEAKVEPDYAKVVDISTKAAQFEMIVPSLMAIVVPILVGLILGPSAVVSMLVGSLITGFILAVFMANSGGSWDNAKKHIESGNLGGGKGSLAHKAGVVGDTVGDPFKDTAGPAINILIKLMSMVSLVFAGFVLTNYL